MSGEVVEIAKRDLADPPVRPAPVKTRRAIFDAGPTGRFIGSDTVSVLAAA